MLVSMDCLSRDKFSIKICVFTVLCHANRISIGENIIKFEPLHEKNNNMTMGKQRCRSAVQ